MALGELETAVMDQLWDDAAPATVREMVERLRPARSLAYTTVLTVLDNLHRKGLVSRDKPGRAFVYRATSSREAHTAELMRRALESAGDRGDVLLRFVERLEPDELEELRETVESFARGDAPGGHAP